MVQRWLIGLLASVLAVGSAAAQDVATVFHFSFSNPGARSLALGGAFAAVADDATAAFANPAGLGQLTRPEVSIEGRAWSYSTPFTSGGRAAGPPTGIGIDEIEYVNAHAPGTPVGDPIEANALTAVFGDRTLRVPVSSTKSSTGHLLGAAGSIAVALTACALRDGQLPPTINLDEPDPACRLAHVRKAPEPTQARYALVPSYGFGGHNSCMVVAAAPDE